MRRFKDILIFSTFIAFSHGTIFNSLYRKTPCEKIMGKEGDQFEGLRIIFIDFVPDPVQTLNI